MENYNKCSKCDKDFEWILTSKQNAGLYCDEHLPCNWFQKLVAKIIFTIAAIFNL